MDPHALAIMHLATPMCGMNEHKPRVAPNNYSPVCHVYTGEHKARTWAHASSKPGKQPHKMLPPPTTYIFWNIYTCAATTRLVPWRMPLPSPFYFTPIVNPFTNINACLFPFLLHTWVSLLFPPNCCLHSAIPWNWCCPHDLPLAAASSSSWLALLWRRYAPMLCSMLVHTAGASPNLQFQRALAHCFSTISAQPLHYGSPISLLDHSPIIAICEQVYHTQPLTSWGSIVCLPLLPFLAANCLSTIRLLPQSPSFLSHINFLLWRWCCQSPRLYMKQLQMPKNEREHLGCSVMWEGHGKYQIKWHLFGDVLLQLRLQLAQGGVLYVTLGHSPSWSYTHFNQSKPIFLPSNAAATTHKNYSTPSNRVKSLLLKFPTNSLHTSQMGSPFFGESSNLWYIKARK